MKNNDAAKLFRKKENKELFGRKKINIVILSLVILLSVLSISFASACLSYLEYKMEDRFVGCIDINVETQRHNFKCIRIEELQDFLYGLCDKNDFGIDGIEGGNSTIGKFYNNDGGITELEGRTCMEDSPILYEYILSDQNVVEKKKSSKLLSNSDLTIIVSADALHKLGMDTNVSFLKYCKSNDTVHSFSVPIYAVVKELPGLRDFMATKAYYYQKINIDGQFKMLETSRGRLMVCVPEGIKGKLIERLKHDGLSVKDETYDISYSHEYSKLIIASKRNKDIDFYDSLYSVYSSEFNGLERLYDFEDNPENVTPEYISCYFRRDSLLQNVENFRALLKSKTGYRIDMNKIYSLKNLIMVQRMGNMLSIVIMVISIVFMCAFVYFLLRSHFQKIQMNLGTFKAFGVSNRTLVSVYLSLMVAMLLLAFAIAFALSFLVSIVLSYFTCIDDGYPWLNVCTWQNWILFVVAIVASVVTTLIVTRMLLVQTPGDLIYQRKKS